LASIADQLDSLNEKPMGFGGCHVCKQPFIKYTVPAPRSFSRPTEANENDFNRENLPKFVSPHIPKAITFGIGFAVGVGAGVEAGVVEGRFQMYFLAEDTQKRIDLSGSTTNLLTSLFLQVEPAF
jgi:hypothetical protein